MFEFVPVTNQY